MYEIYNVETREVIGMADEVGYVRRSPNAIWYRCKEGDAECISTGGIRYSISGREPVEDAPTVVAVRKADAAARIKTLARSSIEHAETLEEVKAAYTDLAEAIIDLYTNE